MNDDIFVLTISYNEEGDHFTHLFHKLENAVNYVVDKFPYNEEEVRDSLEMTNCYEDETNNVSYNIDVLNCED